MKSQELEEFRQGVNAIQEEDEHPIQKRDLSNQQQQQQYFDEYDDIQSSQNQNDVNSNQNGGAGDTYIGEFQTEYINQEVYNMFENEGNISRDDLYICAKAMGGWSQ